MGEDGDHADKGGRGAGDGIDQVFDPGDLRFPRALMGDEGHRSQGEQLVEQVHRNEVAREGDAQGDAEAHGKEAEEAVLLVQVAHVFEGVQSGQGPEHRDQKRKHAAVAVEPQRYVDGRRQMVQHDLRALSAAEQREREQ